MTLLGPPPLPDLLPPSGVPRTPRLPGATANLSLPCSVNATQASLSNEYWLAGLSPT